MHGTLIIDSNGRIVWRDVGHRPFNHPAALLREARRLLRLPAPDKAPMAPLPSSSSP